MSFEFICVSGYGKSGSGACVNLLKEFEHIDGLENEFRIAKDPYGLIDLELSLVSNWEFVRHNVAIDDFLSYCVMLGREDGLFNRTGKGFSKKLNVDFVLESEKYINRLTDYKYYGDTLLHRYKLSAAKSFISRIRSRFGLTNSMSMHFSKPTSEDFLFETINYIRRLYENYASDNNLRGIILDQSVSPNNIEKTIRYFDSDRLVIVDRDPRDIYATMLKERRLLGADRSQYDLVEKYIIWHKAIRSKLTSNCLNSDPRCNILELRFEDFFVNYERVIETLKNFLEIDFVHKDKGSRFNPETMSKHVGIWRNAKDQKAMDRIFKEFPESCFHD